MNESDCHTEFSVKTKKSSTKGKKAKDSLGRAEVILESPLIAQPTRLKMHFFTWNNYTPDDLSHLGTFVSDNCSRWCYQEEIGESGTPHIQGCFTLKNEKWPTGARWTEFQLPKQIHWERTKNNAKAEKYCSKDETRVQGSKVYRWPQTKIVKPLILIEKLRPFQQYIIDDIKTIPDDRTINWIVDAKGNMGKTALCRYLFANCKAIIFTGGACADIAQTICGVIDKEKYELNNQENPFIFNISKSTEHISYKAIEGCKDGILASPKYESRTLIFNFPHIWIFANCEPNYDKISADRWKVWKINDQYELKTFDWKLS